MNNLLRTLTESRLNSSSPEPDLKLLLTTVKEARRQSYDAKLSDPFYDSLEGLLHDLRTVTLDNQDAEAFLRPVSRQDVPDYYDFITNPMDLQTMLKKVKQKQYKSKREFKDDLDLIWSNCLTYNASENHPLRGCAMRLKAKAELLLKNITDRKERMDPNIPRDISTRGGTPRQNGTPVNGALNGFGRPHPSPLARSPSPLKLTAGPSRQVRRDAPFPESPAIVRTTSGMSAFMELDREIDTREAELPGGPANGVTDLEKRLREYTVVSEGEVDSDSLNQEVQPHGPEAEAGGKRKLNGFGDHRPRKRTKLDVGANKDPVELWWDAMQSDAMIGSGLPTLTYASSEEVSNQLPPTAITDPPRHHGPRPKKKRKKREVEEQSSNTLLYHMNNNIRTMRRLRTTHAKYSALSQNQSNEDGAGTVQPPEILPPAAEDINDEVVDERPWRTEGSGIEIGEENADDCLHWMGSKVLEHAGFQGSSKIALDVLAGVTSEYLLNVGRTIHFLTDKYANKMTPEEIILHTLFESGITRVYELERYIKDDVLRYGGRLAELEKKLANAYREATTVEAWDDEALFRMEEDEEEEGEFVMGNFADAFGEDFLGLRELGIASEFGLSSLTIPKKLLKGKGKGDLTGGASAAKPNEPPPPFPPPPPFIPFDSRQVDEQIGLLRPYYQQRLSSLASAAQPPLLPAPPEQAGAFETTSHPAAPQAPIPEGQPIVLPDDTPSTVHTKIGPLGQVMKSASGSSAAKKKAKPKGPTVTIKGPLEGDAGFDAPGPSTDAQSVGTPAAFSPETPRKGKGPMGNGPGAKKKVKVADPLPSVVLASA